MPVVIKRKTSPLQVGDEVIIWPEIHAWIQAIKGDRVTISYNDRFNNAIIKTVDQYKILRKIV